MAHYGYKPKYVWHKCTASQVLLLFYGMAEYVKLTSPWGSSDGEDSKSSAAIEMDEQGRFTNPYYDSTPQHGDTVAILKSQSTDGAQIPMVSLDPKDLPSDILDMLYPSLKKPG